MKNLFIAFITFFLIVFAGDTWSQACAPTSGYLVINVGNNKTLSMTATDLQANQYFDLLFRVDGDEIGFTVSGLDLQLDPSYGQLVTLFQRELYGTTVAMIDGNLRITSNSVGANSKVEFISALNTDNPEEQEFRYYLNGYMRTETPVFGKNADTSFCSSNASNSSPIVSSSSPSRSSSSFSFSTSNQSSPATSSARRNEWGESCEATSGYLVINIGGNKTPESIALDYDEIEEVDFVFSIDDADVRFKHYFPYDATYTYQDIINIFEAKLVGTSTAIVNGNLRITSDRKGEQSKVKLISAWSEFSWANMWGYLRGWTRIEAPVFGKDADTTLCVSNSSKSSANSSSRSSHSSSFTSSSQGLRLELMSPQTSFTESYGLGAEVVLAAYLVGPGYSGGLDTYGNPAAVEFYANDVLLQGLKPLPSSNFLKGWTPTVAGTYAIKAVTYLASGTALTSPIGHISFTVTNAPSVTMTSPSSAQPQLKSQPITLSANASDPDNNISHVTFYVNNVAIGQPDQSAPYSIEWTPSTSGTYFIHAIVMDNLLLKSTSTSVSVSVVDSLPNSSSSSLSSSSSSSSSSIIPSTTSQPSSNSSSSTNTVGTVATPIIPNLASTPSPASTIDLARALPAEFDVTNSGQATYKIPVITAPGSAGLVPNVSLNYSSGGGNGIAGLGWSLSAYGAISRCRQTEGVDGVAKPITWTSEDRFCLNGDRLLLASGTYGAVGSTYKTEIDSFLRVTAVGGISGHPDYFTVEYKDGIIETYGNTSDSYNSKNQLSASNSSTVLDWALSKRSDSAGNKIVYNYVKDTDGQRIDTIDYAFGATSTRGAYLQFNYESRNDPISGYVAGHAYKTGKRVSNIKSYNGTEEIRIYTLTYNQSSAYTNNDKLSRINKVQECVGSACSPATEFEWELPDYQLAAVTSTKNFPSGISVHTMGDFNGDGLQDIAWFDQAVGGSYETAGLLLNRPLRYAYGKIDFDGKFIFENQLFTNGSYTGPSINSRSLKAMDLNNDGRMDLAFDKEVRVGYEVAGSASALLSIPMADGTWRLSSSPSTGSLPVFGMPLANSGFTEIAIDINADGLIDGLGWPVGELPWDGELADGSYTPKPYAITSKQNGAADSFDLQHILADPTFKNNASFEYQPDGNFASNMNSAPINYLTQLTGDFNGDGVMDVTAYSYSFFSGCQVQDEGNRYCTGNVMWSLSVIYTLHKANNGTYELRYFPSSFASIYDNWEMAVDLNNDGLSDFVTRESASGWGIRINDGASFSEPQSMGVARYQLDTGLSRGNQEATLVDINGDGYQDFVWQKPVNASALIGSSEIKVKYWDPVTNQFDLQEHTLANLPYKIIQNYNSVPFGTPRPDPRMLNVPRFNTDRFSMSDMNGDGILDLVTSPNTQTSDSVFTVRLGMNTKKNANKIVAITNGFGEAKKIQYGRINSSEHYFRLDGINASVTSEDKCEDVVQTNADDTQYTEHLCWTETTGAVDSTKFYQAINDPWFDLTAEEQSLRPSSPVLEAFGPMSVVTDVEVTAPSGSKTFPQQIDTSSTAKLSYYYGQAKMQAGGRGFLGFKNFTVVNRETGIRTETEYRQDWPFIGQVRKIKTFTGKGHKLSDQFNTWGFVNCHDGLGNPNSSCVTSMSAQVDASGTGALGAVKPFLRKSITETRALTENDIAEGAVISTSTETNIYDTKGNVLESSSSITSDLPVKAISKKTVNTYDYSGSTWSMQQGRLQRLAVTANDPTYGSITRTSSFTYYPSGADIGLLQTETIEPDNSLFTVTTTHSYSLGNRTKSVTTANGQTRQSEVAYDSRGRYVDTTYGFFTNGSNPDAPIRQIVSQVVSRDKYGIPTEAHNYISASAYVTKKTATTTFGTPYFTADSTGTAVEIKMGTGTDTYGVCPSDTKVWSTSQAAGGGTSIQCSDILGRTRRAGSIGFDGTNWSLVDTEYDKLGRTLHTSAPYWRNSSERYWTSHSYDVLGRAIETRSPYKSSYVTSTTKYTNLDVEIKNPKGHIRTEKRDLSGQVIEVADPNNGITKFAYDARGNMREMRDPALNTTTVGYDLRDRKTSMSDPDKGNWIYKYNSFGDLVCQMDGKGQTSVQRYDIAGRVFSRTDRNTGGNCDNPNGSVDKYTQWTYDTATNGLGQLASVSDSASVGGSAQYQQSFVYDSFGRASSTTTTMPGHLGAVGSHYEKVTYDQYGRVFQSFDAARTSASFTTNGVQNIYNAQGYLHKAVDAVSYGGAQQAYYTVKAMNARGNVTSAEYGNGVTQGADYYPETGLTKTLRADRALVPLPLQDITLDWDELGNLDWRHEQGTAGESLRRNIREEFDYDSLNRLRTWITSGDLIANETANYNSIDNITDKTGIGNYLYGNQCGAGTNAGPHALCRAGTTNYNYDKNGNMLNDSAGRTMKYTSYDLPSEISKSSHKTEFSYGPSRARYKRVDTSPTSQVTTTLYLGSVEKVYYPDGSIQWKRNIAGVGLITQTVNSSGVKLGEAQRYLIKDHLGSLSLITDEIGAPEQRDYFDPWGRERKIITSGSIKQWLADNANFRIANKPITTRGFTGHEQLAEVGLIHMNGRIYDGALGRFVQADPIIQDPLRVQSLNRYSYVWNNPLNATDPSGFESCRTTISGEEKCTKEAKDDKPVEEVKVEGSKQPSQRNSGFSYTITNPAAVQRWLKDNNMSMDDFSSMMKDRGISKASGSDRARAGSGVLLADGKGNVVALKEKNGTAVYALGEVSDAAQETNVQQTNEVFYPDVPCSSCPFTPTPPSQTNLGEKIWERLVDTFNALPPQMGPGEVKLGIIMFGKVTQSTKKVLDGIPLGEAKQLMSMWDKASFDTLADSIRYHAKKHGYGDDMAKYLRKSLNFNKNGATRKNLEDGATRWNRKNGEFLIERNGKIVTYGTNP